MVPAAAGPIETLYKGYEAAYKMGDASALAKLYTDDAVLMPPDGSIGTGANGVAAYFQPRFDQFKTSLAISVEESGMIGEWGFARGDYTATLTRKTGGDTAQIRGRWMQVCRVQTDGSWRIARHTWTRSAAS